MLVGAILVPVPFANVNVKKLFVDKLTDAVFDAIESADTCPLKEPVRITCWFNGFTNEAVDAIEALCAVICKPFI